MQTARSKRRLGADSNTRTFYAGNINEINVFNPRLTRKTD